VQRLFAAIPDPFPLPIEVTKGYWNTIRICWNHIEVEIFDDRYEVYQLGKDRFAIEYFECSLEGAIPSGLIDRLSRIS